MVRISNLKLIELLSKNSRLSYVRLATIFGVSETAVRKRIAKLMENGIIKKFTIEIDPKKLGFEIIALIGIDTTPQDYMFVIEKLKRMREIRELYSSTGDHMLMLKVWMRNSEELSKFLHKIRKIKGVTRICPAIILERLK